MHRSVVVVTVNVCCDITQNIRKKVILGKSSFKVVFDGYFYNSFIYGSVVMATVKMGGVTILRIFGKKSYCW